ncbi:diguanylate cyclase [Lutibacter sp. B2]|nr:diguanylate cyclase [Lutibacter sp. B2]
MKKSNEYIDMFFMLLMIIIFTITTYLMINSKDVMMKEYILYSITFLLILITYATSIIIGLLVSSIFVFTYGSYILYQSMVYSKENSFQDYFWIIVLPIVVFVVGKLSANIKEIQDTNKELRSETEKLVTIDPVTGLQNTKGFYIDLDAEMSRAKRYGFNLSIMICKIQYFEELMNIYGEQKTQKIIKKIADELKKSNRNEDKIYKLKEDVFAVILPNTDLIGSEVVKDRFRTRVDDVIVNKEEEIEHYHINLKIGMFQYSEKVTNPFMFKELAEKELEFDV